MGAFIWGSLQRELAPLEDRSSIRFSITGPEGTSFSRMVKISDDITNYLYDSIPERDFVFARTPAGPINTTQPRLALVDPKLRTRSQDQIANELQKKLSRFNDARIAVLQEQTIAVGLASKTSLPIQFVLQNQDLNKLKEVIPKFLEEARKDKTFSTVDVNLKFNKPEVDLTIDRLKVRDLGLSTKDVISALQASFSGGRLAYFIMNGYQYPVIAQLDRNERNKPGDISKLYILNKKGESIPLSEVVHLEENSNPAKLFN
jgi:HAE1 family hydrophobic/amphiphilic exporter-1/multidrug efflux pump